jgi:hypothetical protein
VSTLRGKLNKCMGMKVRIEKWQPKNETVVTETGFRYLDTNSVIYEIETWEGDKEDIFKRFDKKNNSLRYCNGSYYKFEDSVLNEEYKNWYKSLDESTKFNMFYGNGVVD